MPSVLFVCLGNICRSPAAEGILRHRAKEHLLELEVASCGLGNWHQGNLPDPRMREAAQDRGVILTSRAQAFDPSFFDRFDYILAADRAVLLELYSIARTPAEKAKIHYITLHSKGYPNAEIPDPYYGNRHDFDLVLDMCEDACEGLIQQLKKEH